MLRTEMSQKCKIKTIHPSKDLGCKDNKLEIHKKFLDNTVAIETFPAGRDSCRVL